MIRMLGLAAVAVGALALTGTASADCTPDNWKGCAGKPWVDGDKMDTPLGSKWWPNPLGCR